MLYPVAKLSALAVVAVLVARPPAALGGEPDADRQRAEAAGEVVRALNERLTPLVSVVIDLSDDAGHRIGSIVEGPSPRQRPAAVTCTSYGTAGRNQAVGVHDRVAGWQKAPHLARAAFQHDIVTDIFSCLQKAGFDEAAFHESGGGGAVLLAKYDPDVRMGQLVAATVLLDVLAGVDLAPARIERDEMAEDAKDDPTAAPQARIMAMALKAGAGVADVRTYRDIAERAGAIAAAAYGFTAAGPGHWRAPDGLVVSVSPSSRDFGWQVVPGSDGEEYQRRFGDLRKDAEADDAGRAARKMATGGE